MCNLTVRHQKSQHISLQNNKLFSTKTGIIKKYLFFFNNDATISYYLVYPKTNRSIGAYPTHRKMQKR